MTSNPRSFPKSPLGVSVFHPNLLPSKTMSFEGLVTSNPLLEEVVVDQWEGSVRVGEQDKLLMKKKGVKFIVDTDIYDSLEGEDNGEDEETGFEEEESEEEDDSASEDNDDDDEGYNPEEVNYSSDAVDDKMKQQLREASPFKLLVWRVFWRLLSLV